jgi:hypothetical protein
MTKAQTYLYWREYQAACRAAKAAELPPLDRHELHRRALGKNKSSKLFTNADLDKVLAIFRSYTRPADLRPQLRQLRMPRIRLEHKIVIEQAALLAVVLPPDSTIQPFNDSTPLERQLAAESYILQIMRERFGTTDIKAIPHDLDNTDPTRKDTPLEMLRNTLSSRINTLRAAKRPKMSIRDMYELAGLACTCAPCRRSRQIPTTAPELAPEPEYAEGVV